jgi:YD repeat-containing protein
MSAKFRSRSHDAVIYVYDAAGKLIEVHRHKGDFKELARNLSRSAQRL